MSPEYTAVMAKLPVAVKGLVVRVAAPFVTATGEPILTPFDWNCTVPVGTGDPAGALMLTEATIVCPISMLVGFTVTVPAEVMGGSIVMLNAPLTCCAAESATLTVKFVVPAAVGVPEIVPSGVSESPAGRLEAFARLHIYGGVPPLAISDAE